MFLELINLCYVDGIFQCLFQRQSPLFLTHPKVGKRTEMFDSDKLANNSSFAQQLFMQFAANDRFPPLPRNVHVSALVTKGSKLPFTAKSTNFRYGPFASRWLNWRRLVLSHNAVVCVLHCQLHVCLQRTSTLIAGQE